MADDSDNRGRGPRKGGGGGSRGGGKGSGGKGFGGKGFGGGGRGFGAGESRGAGERRAFRGHSEGSERPARRFGAKPTEGAARPARSDGDRPQRPRPQGEGRPFRPRGEADGTRPARSGFGRPPRRSDAPAEGQRPDRPWAERGERPRRPREDAPAEGKLIVAQEPERIAKVMARAGVASRRDSEAMIAEGRVSVNGQVLESPAYDVKPGDDVLVDGEPLPARERTRLWLFHKPRGVVTTNFDPEGRPTVFDALPEDLPRVLTIGRLDINTEGLLLLTNDGGLARVLELPETGWLRRYRVRAFGEVTQATLDTVKDGVTVDGVHYGPVIARFERQQGFNTWLTVDLREGKNREVKTVLEHLGLTVNRLIRISFGPFQLGDLPEGEVEEIRSRVLQDQLGNELAAKAGADFEAPRRDALPSAPPRREAPAADDRPRRRADATRRDSEASPPRLRGDKPWTRGVWRDEDEAARPRKAPPRRGADPKLERESREASGEVARRRDKAIADPKGRRVLVERVSSSLREEATAEAESRRRPDRKPRNQRGETRPARSAERSEGRPARSFERDGGERPARRPRAEVSGHDRGEDRPWHDRASRGDRPARDANERPARRFSEGPAGDKPRGRGFGGKPGGGKSFGGKPFGGKPGGGRPSGGRPGGGGKGPRSGGGGPRSGGKRD